MAASKGRGLRTIFTMTLAPSHSWYRLCAAASGVPSTDNEPSATPASMARARRSVMAAVPRPSARRNLDAAGDGLFDAGQEAGHVVGRHLVHQRVIGARHDALSDHHLHPADLGEHLLAVAVEAAAVAEQVDRRLQLGRAPDLAAMPPERVSSRSVAA